MEEKTWFENEYGETLTPSQVAERLKVSEEVVRKNYIDLNGMRIGSQYRFFEKRLIENGIPKQEQKQSIGVSVDRTNKEERPTETQTLQNKKRGSSMGGRAKKNKGNRSISDEYNLT